MFKPSQKLGATRLGAVSLVVLLAACSPEYCEPDAQSAPTVMAAAPAPAYAPAPVAAPAAAPAPQQPEVASAPAVEKPLVIIRFGQNNRVNFKQTLRDTVGKVEAAKPGLSYDVVSYVPTTGDTAQDQRQANLALKNQSGITSQMMGLGVAASRITVRSVYTPSAQMGEQEAQIFVR